jgi:hypothetical protein
MIRKALLICGILSSLLYAAMNIFIAMQWKDYSSVSQTVSELSAIDAPTRSVWISWAVIYTLLFIAFGFGVRASAQQNHYLRILGGLIITYGIISLAWPFAPMHLRGTEFTFTDTMHIALAMITVVLMFLAIGFGAKAFGKSFFIYSILSVIIFLIFGALTGINASKIAKNLPTPWVGVWERINIGAFLLWIVVLAIILLCADFPRLKNHLMD